MLASAPSTPDRVVRFELGRTMSPGLKLNVADTKNLLSLQRQNELLARQDRPLDFSSWKQSQQPPPTGSLMKQTMTLGVGVGQLSSGSKGAGQLSSGSKGAGQLSSGSKGAGQLSSGSKGAGQLSSGSKGAGHLSSESKGISELSSGSLGPGLLSSGSKDMEPLSSGSLGALSSISQDQASPSQRPSANLQNQAVTLKTILTQDIPASAANAGSSVIVNTTTATMVRNTVESTPVVTSRTLPKPAANSEMVYIQCMDSSGKVYLIPQQMLKSSTGLVSKLPGKPPEGQAPKDGTKTKTTVVGSGPNKATLTYMLSPQGLAGVKPAVIQGPSGVKPVIIQGPVGVKPGVTAPVVKPVLSQGPLVTQFSKVTKPAPGVSIATGSGLAQKLLVMPGSSPGSQVALVQQTKSSEAQLLSPPRAISVGGATNTPQQVMIRDQAGNVQIVQMAPAIPAVRPQRIVTTISPRITVPKAGLCVATNLTPGVRTVLSPPPLTVPNLHQEGGVRLSLQGSPRKSLVIPKETFGQLQPGQMLQIQIPPNKTPGGGNTLKSPPGGHITNRRLDGATPISTDVKKQEPVSQLIGQKVEPVVVSAVAASPQLMVITGTPQGTTQGLGHVLAKTISGTVSCSICNIILL